MDVNAIGMSLTGAHDDALLMVHHIKRRFTRLLPAEAAAVTTCVHLAEPVAMLKDTRRESHPLHETIATVWFKPGHDALQHTLYCELWM